MAITGSRVPPMASHCFWIPMSPESATCRDIQNACEGHADVWPTLPLLIDDNGRLEEGLDNIIAMLELRNRVCQIKLRFRSSLLLEKIMAAMQVSFPELTHLVLSSYSETVLVIPDSFLATSAPRLRHLTLRHFLFPALPNLLLSAAVCHPPRRSSSS